jgi:hypothetical protein
LVAIRIGGSTEAFKNYGSVKNVACSMTDPRYLVHESLARVIETGAIVRPEPHEVIFPNLLGLSDASPAAVDVGGSAFWELTLLCPRRVAKPDGRELE